MVIMEALAEATTERVYEVLATVKDPEIPVISIIDLGIVREVRIVDSLIEIDITPTYSGCPALDVIPMLIEQAMEEDGLVPVKVRNVLAPAWTTDWISQTGRERLRAFGIAPPEPRRVDTEIEDREVLCPRCNSVNTRLISKFGSTPCKSAFQCNDCLEPFDYFKCH